MWNHTGWWSSWWSQWNVHYGALSSSLKDRFDCQREGRQQPTAFKQFSGISKEKICPNLLNMRNLKKKKRKKLPEKVQWHSNVHEMGKTYFWNKNCHKQYIIPAGSHSGHQSRAFSSQHRWMPSFPPGKCRHYSESGSPACSSVQFVCLSMLRLDGSLCFWLIPSL